LSWRCEAKDFVLRAAEDFAKQTALHRFSTTWMEDFVLAKQTAGTSSSAGTKSRRCGVICVHPSIRPRRGEVEKRSSGLDKVICVHPSIRPRRGEVEKRSSGLDKVICNAKAGAKAVRLCRCKGGGHPLLHYVDGVPAFDYVVCSRLRQRNCKQPHPLRGWRTSYRLSITSSAFAPAFALQMTLSSPLLRFSTSPRRGRMDGWTQMTLFSAKRVLSTTSTQTGDRQSTFRIFF
jgi:hypothetical protein